MHSLQLRHAGSSWQVKPHRHVELHKHPNTYCLHSLELHPFMVSCPCRSLSWHAMLSVAKAWLVRAVVHRRWV